VPEDFDGGVVAEAEFIRTKRGIRVKPDLTKTKKRIV